MYEHCLVFTCVLLLTVNQRAGNIEDIVPFPKDMPANKSSARKYQRSALVQQSPDTSVECSSARSDSTASSTSDDMVNDTHLDYKCESGVCSYQQRRQCAGLLRCYQTSSRLVQVGY